ncbi:MAG: hypothetical protein ACKOW2_07670 [Sphingobacteriaceae bacterium]
MFKQFLNNTDGYNIYLIVSLGIFMVFFILVGTLVARIKKEEEKYLSDLPLNENTNEQDDNSLLGI